MSAFQAQQLLILIVTLAYLGASWFIGRSGMGIRWGALVLGAALAVALAISQLVRLCVWLAFRAGWA